jgi:disulfide bond formation protein DsbB
MRARLSLAAAAGSAALLLAALWFQHFGGLAPCPLCLWQRWPHGAALAVGGLVALAAAVTGRVPVVLPLLGAAAAATTAGIGVYHTGVERGWWPGPDTCAAPDFGALTPDELLSAILAAPVVRCTDVPWEALGLSMASWNALASAGLALLWLAAAVAPRRG